jgi:hypothetical protein
MTPSVRGAVETAVDRVAEMVDGHA